MASKFRSPGNLQLSKDTGADPRKNPLDTEHPESLDPQDWDRMKKLAHQMVDDSFEWLQTLRDRPVWQPMPDLAKQHFTAPAPRNPSDPVSVYEEFTDKILRYPMGTPHPRFWAWYMGSGNVMSAMADFLASIMNSNLGGGNHSAPYVEAQVISWLRELMGLPEDASGLLTSGASMANLMALAVARNTVQGLDIRHHGVASAPGNLFAYASNEVHSCMQKAVETLGLGSQGLKLIDTHDDYTIRIDALREQIRRDRADGNIPFCVVANAGTINTGAIDNLPALADFCESENIWFHIDGAIGAIGMLSEDVSKQLAGMERADSIALDLHKWMHIPFEAGAVLVRDRSAHKESFYLSPAYLARDEENTVLASGDHWFSDYGLQLSRQFRALKVWMSVQEHGLDRFGRMIDRNVAQARYLGEQVEKHEKLELTAPIGLDIVCFRYNPGGLDTEALNELNKAILSELQRNGIAAPSYTTLDGVYCLRAAISNHRSLFADFDCLVESVLRIGEELARTA